MKYSMNNLRIDVLDIVLFRTGILCTLSCVMASVFGHTLYIEKSQRKLLALRCLCGTIGFTCFTFGVSMLPLVVLMIIANMAPFWTYFLAWLLFGDSMSSFETVALVLSFGSVIMIATAKKDHDSDDAGVTGLYGM